MQLRKRAKDVLLCCTDRALALLLNTLSLGPPEVHHEAVRGWRGRVDRISAIAAASDFLAQPTPQACAAHAAAAADSALCGSLPRRGEAAAAPVRHEPTPEAEECPILAVLSGRSGYVGGSPGPSEGAATPPCACSTPVEPPDVYMGGDVEDAAVPLPPPESVPASRRATDGSFAEASAAAEILTQLVGAARAAQSRPRGDGSGLEGAPLGGPAWGEFGEGPARAEASSPFVVEVLEEARRALDDIRSSSQHTAHAEESGAASSVAGLPDEGDAVGGAPAGAAAGETPTRPKKVRRVKMARGTEVGESAAEMGGVVGSAANWTEPETPEAAGMGAQRPGGAAGTAAAGMPASAWGRRARGEAGGGQGHVGANEGGRRAGEGEPAGACAAGGSGVLLWDAGSRGGSGDGTSGPAWETVRWQEVARGHGCELRGIARLWASVAACEEREPAAQLLHKALTGVPGRNKKIRLQTLSGFCGLAKAVGQGGGVRPETVRGPTGGISSRSAAFPVIVPALKQVTVLRAFGRALPPSTCCVHTLYCRMSRAPGRKKPSYTLRQNEPDAPLQHSRGSVPPVPSAAHKARPRSTCRCTQTTCVSVPGVT